MNAQGFNFQERTIGGITYYIIPKTTYLYHGSNRISSPKDLEKKKHTFFALTNEYANKYANETGTVLVFQPTEELKLVAMDKDNEQIYRNAPKCIKKIMDDQYGFHNNHKRKSDPIEDNELSKYLCNNKYQGYAADKMKGISSFEDLDAELIICDKDKLTFIEVIKNEIRDNAPRVERKKRPPTMEHMRPTIKIFDERPVSRGLFGDDEDEGENADENEVQPRGPSLFGDDEDDDNEVQPRGPGLFGDDEMTDERPRGPRLFEDEEEDEKIGGKKKQNISTIYKKNMKRPVRSEDGTYTVKGKKYKELFGSREQVHNGTAYKTKAGLTNDDILMNKWGRLVSAKKHKTAKKEMRLEKYGYTAKKGKFGYVKKSTTRKQKKEKKE
jgi:hypothetical protein